MQVNLIGAENGFIHYNPSFQIQKNKTNFSTNIVKVKILSPKDSVLIFGQYDSAHQVLYKPLAYENNGLRFSFSSTHFESNTELQFSTKLLFTYYKTLPKAAMI